MSERLSAEFSTDKRGQPCVTVLVEESTGWGWQDRDYVDLSFEKARELIDELELAANELEKTLPAN